VFDRTLSVYADVMRNASVRSKELGGR